MRRAAKIGLVVVVSFLTLEALLTFFDPWLFRGYYVYDADLGFRIRPGASGTNSLGFLDRERTLDKPVGSVRVMVLGDSFGWSGGRDCNYIAALERRLQAASADRPVEVLSVGYPMTGPVTQRALLERDGLRFHPDLVVLAFFAGNDFQDSYPHTRRIVVNGLYLDVDPRWTWHLFGRPVVWHSRAWQILRQSGEIRASVAEAAPSGPEDVRCGFPAGPTFTEAAYDSFLENKLEFARFNAAPPRRHQAHIDAATAAIRRIKALLDARGIPLRVVMLPDEVQVNAGLRGNVLARHGLDESDVDLTLPQVLLAGILQQDGIAYLDLTPVFAEAARARDLYIPRDTHWNEAGVALAARSIEAWLAPALAQIGAPRQ